MDISAWLDEVNAASAAGVPAPAYPGSLTQAPASAPVQSTQSILQSSAPTATQGSVPQSVLDYDPWANMGYGAPVQDYWQQYVQKNPLGIDWSTWTPPTGDIGAGGKEFVPGVGPVGFDQSDVTRMMLNEGLGLDYYETRPFGQKTDEELIKKLQGGKDSVKRVDKQYMNPNTWRRDLITTYGLDETGGLKEISSDWDTKDIRSRGFVERAIGREGEKWVGNLLTMGATAGFDQIPKAYSTYKETGDWAQGLDRMVDPAGTIDYTTRDTGDFINKEVPELTPYVQPVATAVGTIIYPGAGTAIGSGIGAKLAGGTTNKDYSGDFINAGASYVGGAAGGTLGNAVGSAIGGTTGTIAGGATTGAVAGAAGQVPAAVETGDWSGVGTGALIGGLAGGLQAGGSALYNGLTTPAGGPSPAYIQQTMEGGLNPSTQNLSNVLSNTVGSNGVSLAGDATLFNVDPSLAYNVGTGLSTIPIDSSLLNAPTPTPIGGHNPLQPTPPTYNLAPELSPIIPGEFPTINSMPEPFSVDSIDKAFMSGTSGVEGFEPDLVDTLTGGEDTMRGWYYNAAGELVPPPTYTLAPDLGPIWADPTLEYTPLNPITDYTMGNIPTDTGFDWNKLLDALGGLGGTQAAAVPGGFPTGREFNGDSSAYVEPPMKSGKGSGSKGLTAEEYEKLYNGTSFMPDTKEIERFNKQGLYYT